MRDEDDMPKPDCDHRRGVRTVEYAIEDFDTGGRRLGIYAACIDCGKRV